MASNAPPDELLGLRLRHQVEYEITNAGVHDTSFHVSVASANGTVTQKASGFMPVDLPRREWARLTCSLLNRHARHGGTWIVAWCEPRNAIDRTPQRVVFLWKDRDGDVPVTFDCKERFDEIVSWGPEWPIEAAHKALARYAQWLKDLAITPDMMLKAAQGERPVARH